MRTVMKKKSIVLALIMVMIMTCLCACSSKKSLTIKLGDLESVELVEVPDGLESCACNGNEIEVTVKADGDYDFVIQDQNGQEYTFTLTYEDGTSSVSTEDNVDLTVGSN